MKRFSKTIFGAYVFVLLWLVLFKLSADPLAVIAHYQTRSLNLLPFAGVSRTYLNDTVYNFVAFVPLGLLLQTAIKTSSFQRKLTYISVVSIGVESLQYIFAIGTSDISDVITNICGGLCGLLLYRIAHKYVAEEKLDVVIGVAVTALLLSFLWLRLFVFHVRYQ